MGVKRPPNANATDTHLRPLKVKKSSYCHAPLCRRLHARGVYPFYISFRPKPLQFAIMFLNCCY